MQHVNDSVLSIGMDIRIVKARRIARRYPRVWLREVIEPVFNRGQFLTFLASVIGLALILHAATPTERDVQAFDWAISVQAFGLALVIWALVSAIRAPLIVIREDRERGTWIGNRRLYYQPVLVSVSVWRPEDTDKSVKVVFDDSENGALVRYRIELDPPVPDRASAFLERHPGELDGILSSLLGPSGKPGKAGGSGSIGTVTRVAYLRVKLDPQTVPVTARVYMTDFSLGEVVL